MTNEIVEKLKKYTEARLQEEAHVVYVVVQLGKIIERDSVQQEFPVFSFYRDWVVHHQLDRVKKDGRQDLYNKVDSAIGLASKNGKSPYEAVSVPKYIAEAISFKCLTQEIENLFTRYSIVNETFNRDIWFKHFTHLLIKVLTDLSLRPGNTYLFEEFRYEKSLNNTGEYEIKIKLRSGIKCEETPVSIVVSGGLTFTVRLIS